MIENKMQYKSVDELIPYKNNARTHSTEQINKIAASMQQYGFISPIVVSSDNGILAGHGRLMAAKQIGLLRVPIVEVSHLTKAQQKAYLIADNKLADEAGWDDELLKIELSELNDLGFDLSLTGFSDEELASLVNDLANNQAGGLTDADDCPDLDANSAVMSQVGDLWQLGKHYLMCGDSTDCLAIEKLMQVQQADLLVTDPPYNVDYQGKTKEALTIANDAMSSDQYLNFLTSVFSSVDKVLRKGAAFYIWHADSEGFNVRSACMNVDWKIRQCLIWNKNTMVMGRQDYHWKHEPCLYGWKSGAAHYWGSDRKQTTILNFDKPL